jgi:ABC-type transport system involved in multi-copper enzyme maturation permease subunit
MSVLPIVARELCVTARRQKTYWLRLAAALGAFVVCAWVCLWTSRTLPTVMVGKSLFSALTLLSVGYCLLVGPFITADCLSEERREGTLGLLFLTDLSSLDVLLGKSVAASLTGFYSLLAILPMLGIPILFGGVTPDEYGRVAIAVVNAILFSLAGGMFVSAVSRDQGKAVLGSVFLVLGIAGLLPGLYTFLSTGFLSKPLTRLPEICLISPAYTAYLATDALYRTGPRNYWISLGSVHAMCWLFMIATAVIVPRLWRDNPEEKPVTHRWFWRFGYTPGWRRSFRRRLERNPVFALAGRLRWPHFIFWGLVTLVAINVYWLTYGYRRNPSTLQFHYYFSHALVFTNRVWITIMACRFLLEARRTGALELMLTTPLPVRTFMRGHWRALRRLFLWPVTVIALLHVGYVVGRWLLLPTGAAIVTSTIKTDMLQAGGSLVKFVTDILALCWVGAWLSLSSKKPTLALLKTYSFVILIPWVAAYSMPGLQSLLPQRVWTAAMGQPQARELLTMAVYMTDPLCWVAKNLLFILWARHGLKRHFRSAAAQSYHVDHVPFGKWRPPFRRRPLAPGIQPQQSAA